MFYVKEKKEERSDPKESVLTKGMLRKSREKEGKLEKLRK